MLLICFLRIAFNAAWKSGRNSCRRSWPRSRLTARRRDSLSARLFRSYPGIIRTVSPIPITGKAGRQHLRTALRVVNVLTELLQEHTKEELHLQPIVFNKER